MGDAGPWVPAGSTRKNLTSFGDSGLDPNTEYCYQVISVGGKRNKKEYSPPSSPPACATTSDGGGGTDPPPDSDDPTELAANVVSSSQIDLTWDDNKENETGYEIWRCEPGSGSCIPSESPDWEERTGPFRESNRTSQTHPGTKEKSGRNGKKRKRTYGTYEAIHAKGRRGD